MRKRIYISGPISKGNHSHNLYQFLEAHERLILTGYAPLNPGLTALCPFQANVSHHQWLDADLPWVEVADAVLRLPGYSVGADLECARAKELKIPIYYSIEELHRYEDHHAT